MARSPKQQQPHGSGVRRDWLWGAALAAAVFLVYSPMLWAGFVWDDANIVTVNPSVTGPHSLLAIWTTAAADICPLTLTAFSAEYHLWASAPLPYHIVNILEHAANAILLWRVLLALRIPGAWLGAAIWALHPVQVESVAWISEMKNTQSGLFYLLALLLFVKSLDSGKAFRRDFILTLLFSALALASKSSTVVLPVDFVLIAWWKGRSLDRKFLVSIVPVGVMAIMAALVSIATQQTRFAGDPDTSYIPPALPERFAAAGCDVWFYLGKLLWPHPLITFYPRWDLHLVDPLAWLPLLGVLVAVLLSALAWNSWGRPLLFAFAYFLVALAPGLGFVDNTIFHFAPAYDHFQYLASMGPLVLLGAGLTQLGLMLTDARRWLVPTLAGALLVLLGITSWLQAWAYENEAVLWAYTLAWNPASDAAHDNLANVLVLDGLPREAVGEFRAAIALNPKNALVHNNLARVLDGLGRTDDALAELQIAVEENPSDATMRENLGLELLKVGRVRESAAQFEEALRLQPANAVLKSELARAQAAAGAK